MSVIISILIFVCLASLCAMVLVALTTARNKEGNLVLDILAVSVCIVSIFLLILKALSQLEE